ncbi:unnamed protein product [Symbiodinium sp. CCMP2456]|nr:unnamed protein product [Symbiodinium sp. CCMP2456]
MGRGKAGWQQQGSQWRSQHWAGDNGSYGWRQQPQSSAPERDRDRAYSRRSKDEEPSFPSYAMMAAEDDSAKPGPARPEESRGSQRVELAKGYQKLVTVVRRAEVKLRKATEEREATQARWHKFQDKLQQAFIKERGQFKKDMSRLDDEIEQQQALQGEALQELQTAIANPGMLTKEVPSKAVIPEDALEDWQSLMDKCDGEEDEEMAEDMARRLGRQLQELLGRHLSTPPRRMTTSAPRTPPCPTTRTTRGDMKSLDRFMDKALAVAKHQQEAAYLGATGAPVTQDPYVTSPGTSNGAAIMEESTRRARGSTPRTGIKMKSRAPMPSPKPGTNLADKLDQARAKASAADGAQQITDDEDMSESEILTELAARTPKGEAWAFEGTSLVSPSMTPGRRGAVEADEERPGGEPHLRRKEPKIYDFMDWWAELNGLYSGAVETRAQAWAHTCRGVGASLLAIGFVALVQTLMGQMLPRGRARRLTKFGGAPRCICKAFMLYMVAGHVGAVKAPPLTTTSRGIPLPSDLETWMAGQQTLREQMEAAIARWAMDRPLEHNAGVTATPAFQARPPGAHAEVMQPTMDEHTIHATFWFGAAFYETEIIDVEMPFPLAVGQIKEALKGAAAVVPDQFDDIYPTTPQLDGFYGSFIAQPSWLRNTDRSALVMDTRPIGGTVFVCYLEGRINRAGVMKQIPQFLDQEVDIYTFGGDTPLRQGNSRQPVIGGVIRVVPRGHPCQWSDNIEQRLLHRHRWNQHMDPPTCLEELHTVYQSADDQVIEEIDADDIEPLEIAAENALEWEHGETLVYLPDNRVERLAHGGRRIFEQVAVMPATAIEGEEPCIVFVDLRPLTYFPQWFQAGSGIFDPKSYIQDLQIPGTDEWILAIQGGAPHRRDLLRVRHQETLTMWFQESTTTSEASGHDDGDGGEDDDSSDDSGDPIPGSSEFSDDTVVLQPGDPPRGPPPPLPVDRSRSPRRRSQAQDDEAETPVDPETTGACPIKLRELLDPPCYDMTQNYVGFPHKAEDVSKLLAAWPARDDPANLDKVTFKTETVEAMKTLTSPAALWKSMPSGVLPDLHIYTDGSWCETRKLGGYAVVALLVTAGASALCETIGAQTQGNSTTAWTFEATPALKNEQIAIATALLWLLQGCNYVHFGQIVLFFDCYAAGWPAEGTWSPVNGFSEKIRVLEQLLSRLLPVPIQFAHTKAHAGNPFNEMADVLANHAARATIHMQEPPPAAVDILQHCDLSWLPLIFSGDTLPIRAGQGFAWAQDHKWDHSTLKPEQLIPTQGNGATQACEKLETKILSLNAQTLSGKSRYFEDQLDHLGYNIACFQETRGAAGLCASKRYLRLATSSAKHWGTAIWISKTRGICSRDGRPCIVQAEDILLIHEAPRLLILSVKVADRQVLLVSGHCPHSAQPREASDFLHRLQALLQPYRETATIFMGIDLNGRIPTCHEGITGSLRHGDADENGRGMLSVAKAINLWFPSTFCEFHQGTTTTYRQANGADHRIDYIGTGGTMEIREICSWVEEDFDVANTNEDHSPVAIDITATWTTKGHARRLHRPKYDTEKMLTAEGRRKITEALRLYSPPGWQVHPDDHCQHLQDYLHAVMAKHFAITAGGPRATYISDSIWELRQRKLSLKYKARHRRQLWTALTSRAFLQWKTDKDYGVAKLLAKQAILYDIVAGAVRWATNRIKKGIYLAKAQFLQGLVHQEGDKACDVLRRAKAAGVGGRQARPVVRPLPVLKDADGKLAESWEDRDKIWLAHFGQQEMGYVVATEQYLKEGGQQVLCDEEIPWCPKDLPTLQELEEALRRASRRKAVGLDGLPGEILAAAPPSMAAAVYPLVFKSMAALCQPVQWRGGILQESWKRAGPTDDPQNYRSLFISSQLGKCYHRLLRRRAAPHVGAALHEFHLGAKQRAPVLYPALYVHGFLRRAQHLQHSSAILFIDTTAAYYRVIRELSVGQVADDGAVAQVFKFFDLAPEDVHEFAALIREGGMMGDAGIPVSLRHMAKDLLHRSWFITRHGTDTQLCRTHAGSRPGETWADIVFSFVLSKILTQIMEIATAEDLLTELDVRPEQGPFGDTSTTASLPVKLLAKDCTWADDTAVPLSDASPSVLVAKSRRLASIVLDYFIKHGMQPNLKPRKTAFIMAVRGRGARKVRQACFGGGSRALTLSDLDLKVTIAGHYIHLGGLVNPDMRMQQEARRRLSMAKAAFDSGKALLFGNETIPLQTRASLFSTSITATFFNLALWTRENTAWAILDAGFSRLLRGLLAKRYKGDMLYKKGENQPTLQYVTEDLAWLTSSGGQWPTCGAGDWHRWQQLMRDSTAWVKRRVQALMAKDTARSSKAYRTALCHWAMLRRARARRPIATQATRDWTCRPCGKRLRTKAALGAHFFKVHGRCAKYRAVVAGTYCGACGKEFWARNKLAIHLRDNQQCARVLHQGGYRVACTAPGLGSRAWRQQAEEDFTLAVSQQVRDPLPAEEHQVWDTTMERAYAELCDSLQTEGLSTMVIDIVTQIQAVFKQFPLYMYEMAEIAAQTATEARELRSVGVADYWNDDVFQSLCTALEHFETHPWKDSPLSDGEPEVTTLRTFLHEVEKVDWTALCPYLKDVTPDASLSLSDDWEVALLSDSRLAEAATVDSSYWLLLPEQLRKAWDAALEGRAVQLSAPSSFWDHPLSLPFGMLKRAVAT